MDMSPTNNFITTLTQTPVQANQLVTNINNLKSVIDTTIKYLSYPQQVADDLTKLYDGLQTANELLSVVTVIPEVGEAAAAFKDAIMAMTQEVGPAKDAAVSLANKIKPLLGILQKLDDILAKGVAVAQDVATRSAQFLKDFTTVAGCINALPESPAKETAQNYLNQFSDNAEPEVSALNSAIGDINSAMDALYNELNNIANQLSPLAAIDSAINSVLSALNPVINLMSSLKNDLMSIEIPIPLPYPHMVSLYDIFNTLGSFIDLAMKPIQGLVDDLLNALNISLPSIPGLSDILNININIPDIPDFNSMLDNITNMFTQLEAILNQFKLNCPPAPDQTDFNTQLKG
nr:hypothetical protein [uncultured Pedobacter sp.]